VLVDTVKAVLQAECFFTILLRLNCIHPMFISNGLIYRKKCMMVHLDSCKKIKWHTLGLSTNGLQYCTQMITSCNLCARGNIWENSGDRNIHPHGLLAQMYLEFIGLLVTFSERFGDTRCLSHNLQSASLGSALDLIEACKHHFHCYRLESYFEGLWKSYFEGLCLKHCWTMHHWKRASSKKKD